MNQKGCSSDFLIQEPDFDTGLNVQGGIQRHDQGIRDQIGIPFPRPRPVHFPSNPGGVGTKKTGGEQNSDRSQKEVG